MEAPVFPLPSALVHATLAYRFETIPKIVSGSDDATLELVAQVYETIIKAGVHRASSIRVAESARVIENTRKKFSFPRQ